MKIIKELEVEYRKFLETNDGKKWYNDKISEKDYVDFGDYLYDFYPEYLQ